MMAGERVTAHFSADEVLRNTGESRVPDALVPNVRMAAERMEQVRHVLGDRVITPTNWLRDDDDTARLREQGYQPSSTSGHKAGFALDFQVRGMSPREVVERLYGFVRDLQIDELFEYDAHVHISFDPRARGKVYKKVPTAVSDTGFVAWKPTPQDGSAPVQTASAEPVAPVASGNRNAKIVAILTAIGGIIGALLAGLKGGN